MKIFDRQGMNIIARNIDWDTDGDIDARLPSSVLFLDVPVDGAKDIIDEICDALSDHFGFCHFGFGMIDATQESIDTEMSEILVDKVVQL